MCALKGLGRTRDPSSGVSCDISRLLTPPEASTGLYLGLLVPTNRLRAWIWGINTGMPSPHGAGVMAEPFLRVRPHLTMSIATYDGYSTDHAMFCRRFPLLSTALRNT